MYLLHDVNDDDVNPNVDHHSMNPLPKPSFASEAIVMAAAILAVVLVALVTITAAIAVAIIGAALVSCFRICGKRERARPKAARENDLLEGEAAQDGYEAELDM